MDNQTIVDMELESPYSEDRDDRFPIPTPPIIGSSTEIPLIEPMVQANDDLTTPLPKEINITDMPIEIGDSILKSPSPTQIGYSIDENFDAKVSPTNINGHQDNSVIKTTSVDQTEAREEEEPTAKRIKVDLLAPSSNKGLLCFILPAIFYFTVDFRHKISCYTK